jgi:hypothetical protein
VSPPSTVSTCLVTAYVTAALGREVTEVQPLQGSVANQDFLVRLAADTSVVIKVGPARELAAEAWACQVLPASPVWWRSRPAGGSVECTPSTFSAGDL